MLAGRFLSQHRTCPNKRASVTPPWAPFIPLPVDFDKAFDERLCPFAFLLLLLRRRFVFRLSLLCQVYDYMHGVVFQHSSSTR